MRSIAYNFVHFIYVFLGWIKTIFLDCFWGQGGSELKNVRSLESHVRIVTRFAELLNIYNTRRETYLIFRTWAIWTSHHLCQCHIFRENVHLRTKSRVLCFQFARDESFCWHHPLGITLEIIYWLGNYWKFQLRVFSPYLLAQESDCFKTTIRTSVHSNMKIVQKYVH